MLKSLLRFGVRRVKRWLREEEPPLLDRLRVQGLEVGANSFVLDPYSIDQENCHLIQIGRWVTVGPGAVILAHDAAAELFTGFCKIARTRIEDFTFIGQRAIILPGLRVGPRAIVGAGAIVTRDVPPDTVVAGNPARPVCNLSDYLRRHLLAVTSASTIPYNECRPDRITPEVVKRLRAMTATGAAYLDHLSDKPPEFDVRQYLGWHAEPLADPPMAQVDSPGGGTLCEQSDIRHNSGGGEAARRHTNRRRP